MLKRFEKFLAPTQTPSQAEPPATLIGFYWHFARQAKGLFAMLFVAGFVVALFDATIPVFMGHVVTLITASDPKALVAEQWHILAGMAAVLLICRPLAITAQNLVANQAIAANVSNMIRWQNHWHVVRQSWAFFQNDFAGRIANKVMQTGPALRESLVSMITAVWYIMVYGTSAIILLASADKWLALPIVIWFAAYAVMLRLFVPRMRDRSTDVSEARSIVTGRIVDTYTNILTLKLFARAREEDAYVRSAVEMHTGMFHASLRLNTLVQPVPCDAQRHDGHVDRGHRDLSVDARRGRSRHCGDGACRSPGRSRPSPAGWRSRSPTFSRMSAWCRKA